MSNDFNQGFAEGFKAGWEAAQKQAVNYAPFPDHRAFSYAPPQPPLAHPDPNNPWTAHATGHGRYSPAEKALWQNQLNETGLNLHTTTPEYEGDHSTMPHPTKVL